MNQDSLGIQAFTVSNEGDHWILRKPLANGDVAIAYWNDTTEPWVGASAAFAELGLSPAGTYEATDLWTKEASTVSGGTVTVDPIPPHATVMMRLSPGG